MANRITFRLCITAMIVVVSYLYSLTLSSAKDTASCVNHGKLVELIQTEADAKEHDQPIFRIKRANDGQSLVYWHFGENTGSFYAATFKTDGCAILTSEGAVRRFAFPKTAFNTGVFFELDVLELSH